VEKISLKDALKFLADLPDNSVDLAISSPPYFMGKEYDTSCSVQDFVAIHEKLSADLIRVIKPGGSICWQVGSHVRNNVMVPLDALVYSAFSKSDELRLRNRIVWTFGHGAHCARRFSGRHETILWFTKGDQYHFALDAVRIPQKYPGKKHYKGPKQGKPSGNPLGKNPGDVWEIPNVKAGHVEKTDHPCQFPVALAQRLVKALCPANGLVIDPYMGAGSTGVAAIAEGRQFVGCDIEPRYVDIARERIQALQAGTLKTRPIDQPIHVPGANDSVAMVPRQWLHEAKKHSASPAR
jgi:adenine-specific DNA-methyltransferase